MADKRVAKLVVEITDQALDRLQQMGAEYKKPLDEMLGEVIGYAWERNYNSHIQGDYVAGVTMQAVEDEPFWEGQTVGFTFPQATGYGIVERWDESRVWLKLTEATKQKFPGGADVPLLELDHLEVFEL